jgi:hypothetical protein
MLKEYIKRAIKAQPCGKGKQHSRKEWVAYNLRCIAWLLKHRNEPDSPKKRKNMQRDVLNARPCTL